MGNCSVELDHTLSLPSAGEPMLKQPRLPEGMCVLGGKFAEHGSEAKTLVGRRLFNLLLCN